MILIRVFLNTQVPVEDTKETRVHPGTPLRTILVAEHAFIDENKVGRSSDLLGVAGRASAAPCDLG